MKNYHSEGGSNMKGKNEKIQLHGKDKKYQRLHKCFFLRCGRSELHKSKVTTTEFR